MGYITKQFEEVTVDILKPGDTIILPPGYIHAVISVTESSLINLSIFGEDWISRIKELLKRELEFCRHTKDKQKLELILGRREKDFMMFKELSERITGNVQHDLDIILENEGKALEEIRRLRGSVR